MGRFDPKKPNTPRMPSAADTIASAAQGAANKMTVAAQGAILPTVIVAGIFNPLVDLHGGNLDDPFGFELRVLHGDELGPDRRTQTFGNDSRLIADVNLLI
jgi:hypothetical protein